MNLKPNLYIVEGPQGVGKTTLTNLMREQMIHSQLFRLSGCGCDLESVKRSAKNHINLMDYLVDNADTGLNAILDRSFVSEIVYSMYKGNHIDKFRLALDTLLGNLAKKYNVVFVLLIGNTAVLEERLQREKPNFDARVLFDKDNSVAQQKAYVDVFTEMSTKHKEIKYVLLDTSERSTEELYNIIKGYANEQETIVKRINELQGCNQVR